MTRNGSIVAGESGGGLNLALLYATLLDCVGDCGAITVDQGREVIRVPLANQVSRIEYLYGCPGEAAVTLYITDALAHLAEMDILKQGPEGFVTGPRFVVGKPMTVVKARKGKPGTAIRHTVLAPEARARLAEVDRQRATITELVSRLREDGPGLRPTDEQHVQELIKSVEEFGLRDDLCPVLQDQHGRILSGFHRLEVGKRLGRPWRRKLVRVRSDAEALAIAWASNSSKPWARADRQWLERLGIVPERAFGNSVKRELITAALIEDATRSNREIAEQLGVSHMTVEVTRKGLEENGQIVHFPATRGRGRRTRDAPGAERVERQAVRPAPPPPWWPMHSNGGPRRPAINPSARVTVRGWINNGIKREYGEAIKAEIDAAIAEGLW